MSSSVQTPPAEPVLAPDPSPPDRPSGPGRALLRLAGAVAVPIVAAAILWATLDFLRNEDANRFLVVGVALVIGVLGVFALFWSMNRVVEWLPARFREGARPYVFVGPALVILSVFLIYPVVNTILISFQDA